MAERPELSAAPGVQNVVVYISNDNFSGPCSVGQQDVSQASLQNQSYSVSQHSITTPMLGTSKGCQSKHAIIKSAEYPHAQFMNDYQDEYVTEVVSGNNLSQPTIIDNINYPNLVINHVKNYPGESDEVLSSEKQAGSSQPKLRECEPPSTFVDSNYITVMGAECPSQNVRCDSVRSETAESSCSSLSSADEGIVLVQNPSPEIVVYDPSVSVRSSGGVVVAVGPSGNYQPTNTLIRHVQHQTCSVQVPFGWKRILNNGNIIYISPSNIVLSNPDQAKDYLLSSGTCKCGLQCHFKYDSVFNFDPKVISRPCSLDKESEDLTKLCNHKRKILPISSLDPKTSDPTITLQKDYSIKRKKRKMGMSYRGGVSVSQILAHREKLNQHGFNKEEIGNQQFWTQSPMSGMQMTNNRLQSIPEHFRNRNVVSFPSNNQAENRLVQTMIHDDSNILRQPETSRNQTQMHHLLQAGQPNQNMHMHHHHHVEEQNSQIINIQKANQLPTRQVVGNDEVVTGFVDPKQTLEENQQSQQRNPFDRVFINGPNEPSGPGRPVLQTFNPQHKLQEFYGNQHRQQQYSAVSQFHSSKNVRHFMASGNQSINGFRAQGLVNPNTFQSPFVLDQQQRMQWQQRTVPPSSINQMGTMVPAPPGAYERVPPLEHQGPSSVVWQEDLKKKKIKLAKVAKNRSYNIMEYQTSQGRCPNVDVRQIPMEVGRRIVINQPPPNNLGSSNPSFLEDPSGYLAQQTALLNSTINRQTGANSGILCRTTATAVHTTENSLIASQANLQQTGEVPSNVSQIRRNQCFSNRMNQNLNIIKNQEIQPMSEVNLLHHNQFVTQRMADSSAVNDQHVECQGCLVDSFNNPLKRGQHRGNQGPSRFVNDANSLGMSRTLEDPVTSSTFYDKLSSETDNRPIQGGTVSTSNVSPTDGVNSGPPTPNSLTPGPHTSNPHTPNPLTRAPSSYSSEPPSPNQSNCNPYISNIPHALAENIQFVSNFSPSIFTTNNVIPQHIAHPDHIRDGGNSCSYQVIPMSKQEFSIHTHSPVEFIPTSRIVTTMASGRTFGSNTITSVLAGRANTATVSVNSPQNVPNPSPPSAANSCSNRQTSGINVSKSPLEMVQSVVSSIQVPHSHSFGANSGPINQQQISTQMSKHQPSQNLSPCHILVSSGGQLIVSSTGNCQPNIMPPPAPKLVVNQRGMPPVSVSSVVTNVTASVTQMIPAVAQQVLGQQAVLLNTLPAPFVLQPGVAMSMDGVGQNMQLLTGNVIQQQLHLDNDPRRMSTMLSENKKKGKKRKVPAQTVGNILELAAQQNPGVLIPQQGFSQHIQMAHSPQGITAGPVMQALTLVPNKNGGSAQIVVNGQPMTNTSIGGQHLIANSQSAPHINLLQPVNLINGSTGVVQNFPTIQQFIVPNLGQMVMNPDGTATLLQDTSNLGMQLQLQNLNGQNVLTPVQNSGIFNGAQNILAAGPAGMVIRTPTSSQGKLIQQQQHSPGAQFLSPNGGQFVVNSGQFGGQLSPLVASVSPSQPVAFATTTQQMRSPNTMQPSQQDFIHCGQMGQTLMVPCTPTVNIAASTSNQQNTTFVQQNTTIVQQQTTMVSNNSQLQNFQPNNQTQNQQNLARSSDVDLDQNFIISSNNDNKPMQSVILRQSPQTSADYRHSVSTQTFANQNSQPITTNTFCQTSNVSGGSPPDSTTHSPLAFGGQSSPTVDTTTGSADDRISPSPSNSNFSNVHMQGRHPSCTMAMVHCISSSEPDSGELIGSDQDQHLDSSRKSDISESSSNDMRYHKRSTPIHVAYAESSTMVSGLHLLSDQIKSPETADTLHNYDKMAHKCKNASDHSVLIMEGQAEFDDEDVTN